jgi:hypothetical protein
MKKIQVIILTAVFLFSLTSPALAATTKTATATTVTPKLSTSPTSETVEQKLNQQINNLKEKIASRVAELNLVEKRGIIGTVTATTNSQITITDLTDTTRFVDVDEITKFSSPSAKASSFGISDLTSGTKISVLGTYNKQSKRILARFIETVTTPTFVNGIISDIDKKNFVVTITTTENIPQKIDIETVTKIQTFDKENGIAKYGFSKLEVGDRVYVVAYPEKQSKTLMGTRLLVVPDLPKDPKIVIPEQSSEPSATLEPSPSTKTTKKVTQ